MSRFSIAGALALSLLVGAAVAPAFAADTARVRVVHASPDAPAVDVYLDGTKVDALTNVPFGAISDYLTVPAGDHTVEVFPTGTSQTAVIDASVSLAAGASYTVAATNPVASIQATVFADDPQPQPDKAKVRIIHLSPDAPAVDVAPDGADPVVSNLAYPDATDYLALDGGTYDLEIRPAGTTDVALQLDPVEIANGRAYTVFALGSAAAEPLGGNALQVAVAMDGIAAPATDTVGETAPAGSFGSTLPLIAVLGAAAAIAFVGWQRRRGTSAR